MSKSKMTLNRAIYIIENILNWGWEHDSEFRECLLNAMELTEDEIAELDLEHYVNDEEDYNDPLGIGLSEEEILSYKSAYDKGHLDKTDIMADGFTKNEVEQILNYNA